MRMLSSFVFVALISGVNASTAQTCDPWQYTPDGGFEGGEPEAYSL